MDICWDEGLQKGMRIAHPFLFQWPMSMAYVNDLCFVSMVYVFD